MRLRDWLVGLYPGWWRRRYGEEFEALLEQCLHTPLDVLDILLGAVDAHLELAAVSDWRSMNMNNKLRTAILLVFTAYVAFIVAGLGVYGFADDSPFIPMMRTNLGLLVAWSTLQVGALVALGAVVIGGAPLAWTIVRRAFTSSREDLRLLLVPVVAFAALVLYIALAAYLTAQDRLLEPSGSPIGRLLMAGLVAVFLLGAVASVVAVWKVVSRTDVERGTLPLLKGLAPVRLYEFAVAPSIVATIAMLAMFAATIAWFWLAFSARPDILAGNQGPLLTNSRLAMIATLALMAAAVGAALVALARMRAASRRPPARA